MVSDQFQFTKIVFEHVWLSLEEDILA